ncbi:Ankyrin repeat and KH domain-containing protein mask [Diplonema papillatum]|nr:Ankyrin repeat and KH domain-containing protein mask [Diplonema papillatum]|eukprot:gene4130-6424_t
MALTDFDLQMQTPLSIACAHGWPGIADRLLAAGAAADAEMPERVSPLMRAVVGGSAPIVAALLRHGAGVNAVDDLAESALMKACECEQSSPPIIQALLHAGANVDCVSCRGRTALMYACHRGHTGAVSLLLQAGANTNGTLSEPPPLHLAASRGQKSVIQLLLQAGANANTLVNGDSPLHCAIRAGHDECMDALLEGNACVNVNERHAGPDTPLHLACNARSIGMVRRVLDAGGDVFAIGREGLTPLELAQAHEEQDIVDLLLRAMNVTRQTSRPDTVDSMARELEALRQQNDELKKALGTAKRHIRSQIRCSPCPRVP